MSGTLPQESFTMIFVDKSLTEDFYKYLEHIHAGEYFEFTLELTRLKQMNNISEKELKNALAKIAKKYLGINKNHEDIPLLLLTHTNFIDELKMKIDSGKFGLESFDNVAREVAFQLEIQYFDYCESIDKNEDKVSLMENDLTLNDVYVEKDLFNSFAEYLGNSEMLDFCKNVFEFTMLYDEMSSLGDDEDGLFLEKAINIYQKLKIYSDQLFIDDVYMDELGSKIEQRAISKSMFASYYCEIEKLLTTKFAQWIEYNLQKEPVRKKKFKMLVI